MTKGYYSSFESFALVDGPGIRAVLFLVGCPYRCLYCHNPETWTNKGAKEITVEEAIAKFSRFAPYWKNGGGITISGGEPLLQIDFLIELFTAAKEKGYSTCIDTAGGCFSTDLDYLKKFDQLLKVTDLILMDLKAPNNELHKMITGKDNVASRAMFGYLDKKHFPIWIRYVLLPGYTDDEDVLKESRDFIRTLSNVKRLEVLPYHPFAIAKYAELGLPYILGENRVPSDEEKKHAEEVLEAKNYQGYLNEN